MATAARAFWKGAISFGLVHIPVSMHVASHSNGIDFDWLDKRSMDRVGYKRINKKTGKEISKENIVRGVAYEEDHYVVLSDEEIAAAYPKTTQSIDIESFVAAPEIPLVYLDRPYYLAPTGKGDKVYALLRETLHSTGRIGLARVVIQSKQHLAALMASGPALVLNLLRWGDEIRSFDDLTLPPEGSLAAGVNERELTMARQLVDDMTTHWDAAQFRDSFKDDVMALVRHKVDAGQTEIVAPLEEPGAAQGKSADIIDLTELLRRSLRGADRATAAETGRTAAKSTDQKAPKSTESKATKPADQKAAAEKTVGARPAASKPATKPATKPSVKPAATKAAVPARKRAA